MTRNLLIALLASTFLYACSPAENNNQSGKTIAGQEITRINDWFAARYEEDLARSPMRRTYLGIKTDQDRLDDVSQAGIDEQYAITQARAQELQNLFDMEKLSPQEKISYRLFLYNAENIKNNYEFQNNEYVFTHMSGEHANWPTFMINFHKVETVKDARDYIARLKGAKLYFSQLRARAEAQADKGILLPKFVYPKLISASENIITGAPFDTDSTTDSPLLKDIKSKINALSISGADKEALIEQAKAALLESVLPAYNDLIKMFKTHAARSDSRDGVWKLPNGESYYKARLKHYTTTDLSADEIHEIGKREVARIQDEMRQIMKQVGFNGSLQDFYKYLRTDDKFTYPNNDEGRQKYMHEAKAIIDEMKGKLDDLFITKPKADMIVKRVEPFREATAFGAFYNRPAKDGSRPGIYFINLKNVHDQPIYLMQALAYHEGIPGHHMQIAIGMELEGIPEFRKSGGHTAYIEGWALYAEQVPKQLGLYTDPYKDFGRLSMEIFRAARLVVDTGIHAKKWTREQAVQYMMENISNTEADIRAEIDRYIVWPGQATAYKIGMIKIMELKEKAQKQLGDKFDIREFHDVILANGSVPLVILEELVDEWIKTKK